MSEVEIFLGGLWVEERQKSGRDWYAVGSVFAPVEGLVEFDGEALEHEIVRLVAVTDFASGLLLSLRPVPGAPAALTDCDVFAAILGAIDAFGPPLVGVVFSHSSWLGSEGLLGDEETRPMGETLRDAGIAFPQMSEGVELALQQWAEDEGLEMRFHGDDIFK